MQQSVQAFFAHCHADRDMMKLRQEEYEVLPAAVLIEVLVAAVLCMIGVPGHELTHLSCTSFSIVALDLTIWIPHAWGCL